MQHEKTKHRVITKWLNITITEYLSVVKESLRPDQNKLFWFFCYIFCTFNRFS